MPPFFIMLLFSSSISERPFSPHLVIVHALYALYNWKNTVVLAHSTVSLFLEADNDYIATF